VRLSKRQFWGAKLAEMGLLDTLVSYDVELFDPALFSYGLPSAYPPDRSRPLLPTNIYFAWADPSLDAAVTDALRQTTDALRSAAVADGQDVANAFSYGNYALFGTPVEGVYGSNVPRLAEIRKAVDPTNVMGLAGGWKF
jgi:Berberine and berberine like